MLENPLSPAAQQSSILRRRQLHALGWADVHIDHELRYGRWQTPVDGVVVLHNGPLTADQRLWVGVLHAGPRAVLSHLSAARAGGLAWRGGSADGRGGDEPAPIDVLTSKGVLVAPLPGYVFHQTRRPYETWLRPTPSGPPRLPMEHAVLLTAERDRFVRRALGLLAASVQQGLTTADRLQATIPAIRKLRNKALFAAVLGDIAGGAQSFAEIDVRALCEEARLALPVRQAVRLDRDGRRRYLDCEWRLADGRVVVLEVDGSFHLQVAHWWADMRRERAVVLSSSTVLRCSSVELRLEPWAIAQDLKRAGVPRFV